MARTSDPHPNQFGRCPICRTLVIRGDDGRVGACASCTPPAELALPAIPRPSPRWWGAVRHTLRFTGHCGGDPVPALYDDLALLDAAAKRRRRYAQAKANRDNPPRVEGAAMDAAPAPTNRRGNRAAAAVEAREVAA